MIATENVTFNDHEQHEVFKLRNRRNETTMTTEDSATTTVVTGRVLRHSSLLRRQRVLMLHY